MNQYEISGYIVFPIQKLDNYKAIIREKNIFLQSIVDKYAKEYNTAPCLIDYSIHYENKDPNQAGGSVAFNYKINSRFPIRYLLLDDQASIGMKLEIPEEMQIINPVKNKGERYSYYPSKDHIKIEYIDNEVSNENVISTFEEKLSQIIMLAKKEGLENFQLTDTSFGVNKGDGEKVCVFCYEFCYDSNPGFIELLLPHFPLGGISIRKQRAITL